MRVLKKNRSSGLGFVAGAVVVAVYAIAVPSNLTIGYFSVAHKPREEHHYLVHNAAMFFALYLSVVFIVGALVVAIAQAILDGCGLGWRAQLTIHALYYGWHSCCYFICGIQDFLLVASFASTLVVNTTYHLLLLIAAMAAFTQPREEGGCF